MEGVLHCGTQLLMGKEAVTLFQHLFWGKVSAENQVIRYDILDLPFHSVIRRRQWHSTPVLLPGKSHGWRSLVGCSPWGREELDTTEQLHFHFSLSCTGEGKSNSFQYSCLENPRDESLVGCHLWGCTESDMTDAT